MKSMNNSINNNRRNIVKFKNLMNSHKKIKIIIQLPQLLIKIVIIIMNFKFINNNNQEVRFNNPERMKQ